MKPIPTDKDLLLEFISSNILNSTQTKYLINNGYLRKENDEIISLTIKGIETAYGKIDDNRKGTGKIF